MEQTARSSRVLTVTSPLTGEVVGTHPVYAKEQVRATVASARELAPWWADLGFSGRRAVLDRWRHDIADRVEELADLVRRETGKPHGDAVLEIGLALEHLAWAARNAPRVLGRRRVRGTLLAAHLAGTVEYHPLGVVGVIGPWNYPVFTPLGSIGYALAAGNTVVFKPSELTPGTGRWLAESFARVADHPALQVVTGAGDTGAALCRAGVDKVAFTGSTATGKKVMAGCAETLTPVTIEAGGKDALIVDEDADVPAAARAAVWGAMSNAGQTCIGIERVFAHTAVYDEVVAEVTRAAAELRAGTDGAADLGPITLPGQTSIIGDQVGEALAAGARAVVGGERSVPERSPFADGVGSVVQPVVLVDSPRRATVQTEETFGPVLTIDRVEDMDEAVARTNATAYGLGSAVFSRRRGMELAARLRTGMTAVNNVTGFTGIPALPFGGVDGSGFGRIHGADGLREFCYAKSIARQRFTPPVELTAFDRERADAVFRRAIRVVHGSRPWRRG